MNIEKLICDLDHWWYHGTHTTAQASELRSALVKIHGFGVVDETEDGLDVVPPEMKSDIQILASGGPDIPNNIQALAQKFLLDANAFEKNIRQTTCYEIISGHTHEVIGWTHGTDGIADVLIEEPQATFKKIKFIDCKLCNPDENLC